MHNGDDTAHYLRRGYRVVAIEADPSLAEAGQQKFSGPIASGQLTILEIAIGQEDGTASFWISTKSEYNSFSRANASKGGHSCYPIEVTSRSFGGVLAEFGVPYYLKIDIEGADRFCLEAIDLATPPPYVSFEKGRLEDLFTARAKGYSRFKLISQEDFRQLAFQPRDLVSSPLPSGAAPSPRYKARASNPQLTSAKVADERLAFPNGSSGPFGEETDGPWRTLEEVALTWLAFDIGYADSKRTEGEWCDVHCTL